MVFEDFDHPSVHPSQNEDFAENGTISYQKQCFKLDVFLAFQDTCFFGFMY